MILERIPGSRFSRVLPHWKGRTVALLAGGPSLTLEQFAAVHAAHVAGRLRAIAINDSYLLAPWADVHYAADVKWHRWHTAGIDKPLLGLTAADVRERWAAFPGQKCSIQPSADDLPDHVHILRNKHYPDHGLGLSLDPEALVTGRHGGFQTVNLAILAGAGMRVTPDEPMNAVLLLGFDGCDAPDGKAHWHGDHPVQSPRAVAYQEFRRSFSAAERDITATGARVINCNVASAIDSFPKVPLEQALEEFAHET